MSVVCGSLDMSMFSFFFFSEVRGSTSSVLSLANVWDIQLTFSPLLENKH